MARRSPRRRRAQGRHKIEGPTKSWAGKGSSGKDVHRIFCSECGSPIAHDPDAAPEIIALKGGCLDLEQKKALKPVCPIPPTSFGWAGALTGCSIRTPKSGPSASFPSARSISRSRSSTCRTRLGADHVSAQEAFWTRRAERPGKGTSAHNEMRAGDVLMGGVRFETL